MDGLQPPRARRRRLPAQHARDALARLGLDDPTLSAINPRLVYCAATGFGSDGPYGGRPAVDDVIQAWSGLAALNGRHAGRRRSCR
ncbi:CoA transferase [Tistlia consotensis]|uniref:CoA transferase n=1 Tax=Tistlia consotensis TaxID=1321365 RepID=UPI000A165FD8